MNKEYIYIDGKAIVVDETGSKNPIEYYENISEVLVKENLIETMENKIKELLKEKKLLENNKKPLLFDLIPSIMLFILPYILPTILIKLLIGANPLIDSIFGFIKLGTLTSIVTGPLMNILGILFLSDTFLRRKESVKEINAINSELEFLENNLENEKQIIEDLKKNKNKPNKVDGYEVVKVDSEKELSDLKELSNLYYNCGYNEKKYYEYLKKGILAKKLEKKYTDKGIEKIEEYLEEKGPQLVKK